MSTIIKTGRRPGGPVIVTLQGRGVLTLRLRDEVARQLADELAAGRRTVRGYLLTDAEAAQLRGQLAALLAAAELHACSCPDTVETVVFLG